MSRNSFTAIFGAVLQLSALSWAVFDSFQRGYMPNLIFIALLLTDIWAEMVKLTHKLTLLTPGIHVEIQSITKISDIVFREAQYQI